MIIRHSKEAEKADIFSLHQHAFDSSEALSVAQLTIDLLDDQTALPLLSLVADANRKLVGHILFTSAGTADTQTGKGYILAPLAVLPEMQGKGIGQALIKQGLDELRMRGADYVLVLGDPKFYKRCGFHTRHSIQPPYTLDYPEAWMAQELHSDGLQNVEGILKCAQSLSSPKHW